MLEKLRERVGLGQGILKNISDRIAKYYSDKPYYTEEYLRLVWNAAPHHGYLISTIFFLIMLARFLSPVEWLKHFRCCHVAGARSKPYITKHLTDIYQFVCLIILAAIYFLSTKNGVTAGIVVGWAIFRIADIWTFFVYNSLIKGAVRKTENYWSFPRNITLAFVAYAETALLFGLLYHQPQAELLLLCFNSDIQSLAQAAYFSVVTITTLGYGDITPTNTRSYIIISIELMVGMSLLLLALTRFMSLLRQNANQDLGNEL